MTVTSQDRVVPYDPITLSVFQNRFMSIAEAMGRSLQQTSISTNIKERLDYSCAVFAPTGDLVANAPFMPVHLGSMSSCVKFQVALHAGKLKPGDVLLTNAPSSGGSHLPDLTVVTPCFDPNDSTKIIFFSASRAHHADIGGILPGSMPPTSTTLHEEGAMIGSIKVVKEGVYNRQEVYKALVEDPAQYPGCSGCRNFRDVESDLKAQIAANHKGMQLLTQLVDEWELPTVHAYMDHIRDNAEQAVRAMLKENVPKIGSKFSAIDYLDDGSPICLSVTIDEATGNAIFDFSGTGPELRGNLNAPECVVHAAVIYCLRAMIGEDIPLNAGCLVPIEFRIPKGSFLSPSVTAAVCGGNVMTSQRVTDVVLKAFKACAASQGDTNNLTFGVGGKDPVTGEITEGWGYYETIAGGSGAGPGWHGTSGVHTHMTNTRITDPEILERRYPVLLQAFHFRDGSGGRGKYRGGDGTVRAYQFLEPLKVSIMSERRARAPYGLEGGDDASMGRNFWIRRAEDGSTRTISTGGKGTMDFAAGDVFELHTPGGGAWGAGDESEPENKPTFEWEARGRLADAARVEF